MKHQAAHTVQTASAQLDHDLADAAHELKTPIAIAIALCEGSGQAADVDGLRADLRRIEGHLRSLRDQLDAVLEPDAGRAAHTPGAGPADLGAILQAAAGTFGVVAAQKDVAIGLDVRGGVEAVVDAERVGVAVRNLIANAVEHAPAGGRVRATLRPEGAWARIEVADDGPGVPVADRETVFERFRRLERDARRHAGSGLGLAIVREVVAEHGGHIQIADAPEGGALFVVELPLAAPQVSRPAARPRPVRVVPVRA